MAANLFDLPLGELLKNHSAPLSVKSTDSLPTTLNVNSVVHFVDQNWKNFDFSKKISIYFLDFKLISLFSFQFLFVENLQT